MLPPEVDQITDEMQELWDRWAANEKQLAYWRRLLEGLDYRRARNAANNIFGESRRLTPVPKEFREEYHRLTNRAGEGPENQEDGTGMTDVFVQCIEGPPAFPGRLGRTLPVCFGAKDKIPERRDKLMMIAEQMRQSHEEYYGGKWRILQETTYEEASMSGIRMHNETYSDARY